MIKGEIENICHDIDKIEAFIGIGSKLFKKIFNFIRLSKPIACQAKSWTKH